MGNGAAVGSGRKVVPSALTHHGIDVKSLVSKSNSARYFPTLRSRSQTLDDGGADQIASGVRAVAWKDENTESASGVATSSASSPSAGESPSMRPVKSSPSCPSKLAVDLGRTGGECLLYLECATGLRGKPSVRAWAEHEDGTGIGDVVEWPPKPTDGAPTWFSAQSLGFPIAANSTARLHMEVRDGKRLLGTTTTNLSELPGHRSVTRELEGEAGKGQLSTSRPSSCTISFQIIDSHTVMRSRTVFFVRHGESVWNDAKSHRRYHKMASQTDHPLSVKGKEQAEALRDKLSSIAAEKIECAASAMLRPDAVYVSPLTRALQTAIIGLGQVILEPNGSGEIVLMANAREKLNFGGRDTRSKKIGSDILQRSLDELGVLYNDQSDVFKDFAKLRCDTSEVEDRWWTEGSRESDAQLQTRLWQFMSQLLYSPHRTIIVVGHSHFFRAVFKRFVSDEFKSQNPNFARDISTNKLMNCGVARLDLDPRRSLTGGPIVGIESVLGSELVKDKA